MSLRAKSIHNRIRKYFLLEYFSLSRYLSILKYHHKYKQRVRKCPDSDRLIDFMTRDLIDLNKVDTENKMKKFLKIQTYAFKKLSNNIIDLIYLIYHLLESRSLNQSRDFHHRFISLGRCQEKVWNSLVVSDLKRL